jgi:3-ketosteroid 9alpha-monooxygenase subunit A
MTTTADYGLGPFAYPRGWFAVATTEGLTTRPQAARFFGRDFVLYRAEDGRPVMLDAYCPHMGSHLASGGMSVALSRSPQVIGDTIRCPLHGWRFGADGRCMEIPYSPIPIPEGARLRAYPVQDHAGFVVTWHDEEGGEAHYDPAPIPEWDDPSWLRAPITDLGDIQAHQTELIDHHVDKIHIVTVHGQDAVDGWVTHFEGHRLSQRSLMLQETGGVGEPAPTTTESDYRGPGIMLTRMGGPRPMISFAASTPVEDGVTRFWHSAILKAEADKPSQADEALVRAIGQAMHQAFVEDLDILQKKLPSLNPMQIPGDGPFRKVRTWYSQFYNPRAKAASIQARVDGDHVVEGVVSGPWTMSA